MWIGLNDKGMEHGPAAKLQWVRPPSNWVWSGGCMRSLLVPNSCQKPSAGGRLTWRRGGIILEDKVTMKTRLMYCLFVAAALVGAGCSQSENTSQQTPLPPAPPAAPQAAVSPAAPSTQTPALPPGHPNIGSMSGQSLPAARRRTHRTRNGRSPQIGSRGIRRRCVGRRFW